MIAVFSLVFGFSLRKPVLILKIMPVRMSVRQSWNLFKVGVAVLVVEFVIDL